MINRKLLKLIDNHKHIIFTVILMVCGLITNIVITGSLVYLIKEVANHSCLLYTSIIVNIISRLNKTRNDY